MSDSDTEPRPGKRSRLIASATELLHRQGVQATTLAQIAEAADVPPGNVYYYFKSRDDLVRAVIDARLTRFHTLIGSLEGRRSPAARLKALARTWVEMGELVARYGCPVGSLASELDKLDNELQSACADLFALVLDWQEAQFRQMGRKDARDLAITLMAGVQGAALLANTLRDPEIMTREVRRLERWIDSLALAGTTTARGSGP